MRTDRSKKESTSKVQTNISCSIQHGFTRFQVQSTQQSKIYNISIMKSKISRINLWPLVATESDSAGIMPCNAQSLLLQCLWSVLDEVWMFNWAWIHGFCNSPLMFFKFKLLQMARIHLDLARSLLYDDVRWRIKQELCNCYEEMREKKWEQKF